MPTFRAQVNYVLGTVGKWSNVWHIVAADLSSAATALNVTGIPSLLEVLHNGAQIASTLVSDPASNAFITTPIALAGTSTASDDLLPLYNSAKVLFPSSTFGRPDYKYFKGFVTESVQTAGNINSGTRTAVKGIIDGFITDMAAAGGVLVSLNGEEYVDCTVQQAVQMRQMHRKRRRTTPAP